MAARTVAHLTTAPSRRCVRGNSIMLSLGVRWGFGTPYFGIVFFMHVNSKRVNWQYDAHCTPTIWCQLDGVCWKVCFANFRIIKFTSECTKLFMAHAFEIMRNLFVLLFMLMRMVAQNILLTSVLAAAAARARFVL